MTDIFASQWRFLEAGETEAEYNACRPLTICAGLEDLASIYSEDDSTVAIKRVDAVRAAHMMAAAPDLAAALEAIVDSLQASGSETIRQHAWLISAGEAALRRAYGHE
jgi:hypothetical protein